MERSSVIFAKKGFFEFKKSMDTERFWEIYYDYERGKAYLDNIEIIGRFQIDGRDSPFYSLSIMEHVPPKYKLKEPLELVYNATTKKAYVAYIGFGDVIVMMDGTKHTLKSSEIVSTTKRVIPGETEFAKPEPLER